MPSRAKNAPRLLFFGDSHLGAARRAVDAGLIDLEGCEFEFWGVPGSDFRKVKFGKMGIHSRSASVTQMALQVNGKGRESVAPEAFDTYVFYGVRLRLNEFFLTHTQLMLDPEKSVSRAVLERSAHAFLQGRRWARVGERLAKRVSGQVILCHEGFPTWGVVDDLPKRSIWHGKDYIRKVTAEQRALIWQVLSESVAERGMVLLTQPEDTVIEGLHTRTEYAVEGAREKKDISHKSPEFFAQMMRDVPLGKKAP